MQVVPVTASLPIIIVAPVSLLVVYLTIFASLVVLTLLVFLLPGTVVAYPI